MSGRGRVGRGGLGAGGGESHDELVEAFEPTVEKLCVAQLPEARFGWRSRHRLMAIHFDNVLASRSSIREA